MGDYMASLYLMLSVLLALELLDSNAPVSNCLILGCSVS